MTVNVAIIEDDIRFYNALDTILKESSQINVTGKYRFVKDAIKGILEDPPDIALLDLNLPDGSGVKILEEIKSSDCKTEFIALTVFDDDRHLFEALTKGALGYIVKNEISFEELEGAIFEVIEGGAIMSRNIAKRVLGKFKNKKEEEKTPAKSNELTAREVEILETLAKGYTTKKTANKLFISYETVRSHQKNIYKKLQVNSMVEAIAKFRS